MNRVSTSFQIFYRNDYKVGGTLISLCSMPYAPSWNVSLYALTCICPFLFCSFFSEAINLKWF